MEQNLTVAHLLKKSPAWKPKIHYHVTDPILSQINPVHASLSYFININLILSSPSQGWARQFPHNKTRLHNNRMSANTTLLFHTALLS
jgi:hypothetical protein